MANSLNRTIEKGELVVMQRHLFREEYQDRSWREVRVLDGFGMASFTHGSALFVEHVRDGEKCRYSGFDIDAVETAEVQAAQREAAQ